MNIKSKKLLGNTAYQVSKFRITILKSSLYDYSNATYL